MIALSLLPLSDSAPPLTPDGDQARRWAEQELRDPAYAAAQPTPFDRVARAVQEFFQQLFDAKPDAQWGAWLAVIVGIVLVVLIVAAIFIWGPPRAARRSAAVSTELFGEDETRTAAQLRRAAESAAGHGDWNDAVVLRFRGLARGLAERDLVRPAPGTTVHAFARAAARAFPGHAGSLDAAAAAFDDVRYLRRDADSASYAAVAGADDGVRTTQPAALTESPA